MERDWSLVRPPASLEPWASELGKRWNYPVYVIEGEPKIRRYTYRSLSEVFIPKTGMVVEQLRQAVRHWDPWTPLLTSLELTLEGPLRKSIDAGLASDLFRSVWEIRNHPEYQKQLVPSFLSWVYSEFSLPWTPDPRLRIANSNLDLKQQLDVLLCGIALASQNGLSQPTILLLDDPKGCSELLLMLRAVVRWSRLDCPFGIVLGTDSKGVKSLRRIKGMAGILRKGLQT